MNLREKLEYLMKQRNLTKADLSRETGIPYTTIDGILKRNDFEKIKLSTLFPLKDYFNVTLDYLMLDEITDVNYGKSRGFEVNYEEMNLIKKYRILTNAGKDIVNKTINNLLEYEKKLKDEIQLSREEQAATSYIKETIPVYLAKAAAGIPLPIIADGYELIDKDDSVPAGADFGVILSGDSMEPDYPDGCTVWVKSQPTLENGDIGVFIIDGEATCKKYHIENGQCYLVSLNKKYKPIKINGESDIRIVGKVIGHN